MQVPLSQHPLRPTIRWSGRPTSSAFWALRGSSGVGRRSPQACVPGMSQCLEVKVLCPARWRRRTREAQGRHREVGSEGSVERTRGARNTNRIRGVTVLGRVGTQPQSPPSAKGLFCKSGVYARTGLRLTPGELRDALGSGVPRKLAEGGESFSDRPAAVSRGHSTCRLPIGKA